MLPTKELFVIDAHGFLHRNYHALPKLSTSKGEEVGALYGFVNWLVRFVREKSPQYVAVCFDSKGPTNRHKVFKEYKANRPPTDEALVSQLQVAREVATAMGFKVVAMTGAEADDIMATLSVQAKNEGYSATIISSDKDIYQIMGENIKVWTGGAKDPIKGTEACQERFAVDCAHIADYLAIVGDSSDNIPGIAGLGPKSAAELINNFGHLEDILAAAKRQDAKIKPTMLKKILEGEESAILSKKLILLDTALPLGLTTEDLKLRPPNTAALNTLIERFEFKNLRNFLQENTEQAMLEAVDTPLVQGDLFSIDSGEAAANDNSLPFPQILESAKAAKEIFLYAEEELFVLATSLAEYAVVYQNSITKEQAQILFEIVSNNEILKIGNDIKYTLRTLNYNATPPSFINCFDTALAKYCLDPAGEFSLMAILAANLRITTSPQMGDKQRMALYAKHIWQLKENLIKKLKEAEQSQVYSEMEIPLMSVLLNMEANGIMVDTNWLKTLEILLAKELDTEQKEINKIAGREVNINSPKQLGVLLFEELKLPPLRKTKTGYSTDEEALSRLIQIHPIAEHILKYRESAKLKSTYVDSLLTLASQAEHKVHTNFNQTGTVTGRLSSFNPNLQNIPVRTEKGRLIRQAFIADEGKVLLSVDYSQIDLRVLAHESGDSALINAFRNSADIHTQTAAEVFGVMPGLVTKEMRSRAKAINFGIVYGQGPMALSQSLGISIREAKEYIDAYFARYSTVKKWIDDTAAQARSAGYVKTLFGHIRFLPEFEASSARLASFANRASVNTIVQGGSSDIIKKAMIDIYAAMPKDILMLLQVHDELIFEVPQGKIKETAAWVKDKMESAVALQVPLLAEAKAGKNWNEMGKVI
ncbi:MAG: DNA polymerase I [Elusimicrobiota bacterium]|jgi:DNA polymerase-1|nr:DNA polymerase I [Elusimicrobiota bacterium]